jgi:hypothetical protein
MEFRLCQLYFYAKDVASGELLDSMGVPFEKKGLGNLFRASANTTVNTSTSVHQENFAVMQFFE